VKVLFYEKLWLMHPKATAENIHQAQFALDVKKAVLPLYEKVFDVGYPLPKLDTLVVSIHFPELSSYVISTSSSSRQAILRLVSDVTCLRL